MAPGQGSLVYKYKTEVKLSVANGQYDLKNEISADVHIKSLGECNYALQVWDIFPFGKLILLFNFVMNCIFLASQYWS